MEFFKFINSILSNVERILPYNIYEISSPRLAKIYPKFDPKYPFNNRYDIETGLYYGEDICRITIEYNSDDDIDWGDEENI